MTATNYRRIAETMRAIRPYHYAAADLADWYAACESKADRYASEDPRFDRTAFLATCGYFEKVRVGQ